MKSGFVPQVEKHQVPDFGIWCSQVLGPVVLLSAVRPSVMAMQI